MKTFIIGSTAAKLAGVDLGREPKDLDRFTDNPETSEDFWHPLLDVWIPEGLSYATISELYTIKISHSGWDLRNGTWEKHMSDAVKLKQAGGFLLPYFYDVLYKIWVEHHGAKRVNLNMDASDFFADAVTRIYDHDSIHDSVAYGDKPLYESVLKDGQEVGTDMQKVKALPFEEKVKLYREEIYATALERWVIPSDYSVSPRLAYAKALKKTVTSLTKGWSSMFIADNFEIFRSPDMDYVSHHKSNKNRLKKLEKV